MMTKAECIAYVESHLEVRYATDNGAYRSGRKINPDGCVNHSVGCAQPSADVFYRLMNKRDAGWGVNALIGDFDKGEGRIILTLPYKTRPWGVGSGAKGSWNNSRIQWEICEPSGHTYAGGTMIGYDVAKNQGYFERMWKMVVAWNVYVAAKLGYTADMVNDHAESHLAGMGSGHADVGHWWPKHGKSMNALRAEVKTILEGTEQEEIEMTKEEIRAMIDESIKKEHEKGSYTTLADIPKWYLPSVQKLMEAGILNGYDGGKDGLTATIGDNTIRVDETFCRIITVFDRLGVLDDYLQKAGAAV